MPFQSRSQLRTCFGSKKKGWNCEKWLKETPNPYCLPEKKGLAIKCKTRTKPLVGPIRTGPSGKGVYRIIAGTKVYISP